MVTQQFESLIDAARRTGISRNTLRARIAAGEFPAYISGRRILRSVPRTSTGLLTPRYSHTG